MLIGGIAIKHFSKEKLREKRTVPERKYFLGFLPTYREEDFGYISGSESAPVYRTYETEKEEQHLESPGAQPMHDQHRKKDLFINSFVWFVTAGHIFIMQTCIFLPATTECST